MSDTELTAVASRIHVLMRRTANRITDILWMTANADYAREILRLARATRDAELTALAARFEQIAKTSGIAAMQTLHEAPATPAPDPKRHYVGSLR